MKFGGMHYQRLLIRHGIDIGKINIVWAATSIKFSNRHLRHLEPVVVILRHIHDLD
jgi:hypothetical protein